MKANINKLVPEMSSLSKSRGLNICTSTNVVCIAEILITYSKHVSSLYYIN